MSRPVLLPAVDVAGGRAAQVVDPSGGDDPAAVVAGWVAAGAEWVHLVDLDLAFGRGDNADLLRELVAGAGVPVQLSGGVDGQVALETAIATGAARVNLAASALVDPAWVLATVDRWGERVAVGVDVRDGAVVARGSGTRVGPLEQVLSTVAQRPRCTVVLADASRDGTRTGADLALVTRVRDRLPEVRLIASGGVATVADVRGLADCGVDGIVLGAALYHHGLTLAQAREALG